MKNVIITGANGFMGHNLVIQLLMRGVTVYAIDLPEHNNNLPNHNNLYFIPIESFNNFNLILDKFSGIKIDVIYHLAWRGVSTELKNDVLIQLPNIELAMRGIDLACAIECPKIIFTGSVSEYAYCDNPVSGDNCPSPGDMYAACKIATHYIAGLYARQMNIGFIWLLIASTYGPGRDDNNIITYTIKKLLAGAKPSYTGLEQKWDYIFIDDLLRALYLIGEKGISGNTYAIGSGKARQLKEYIITIRDFINPKLPLGIGEQPYKAERIDNSVVDISLLQQHTGFIPEFSFENGIVKTIYYYQKKDFLF